MATASITDNIIIRDPECAKAFADAVEEAFHSPLPHKNPPVRMVTDKDEIRQFMMKRRQMHG